MAKEPSSTARSASTRRTASQVAILLAGLALLACDARSRDTAKPPVPAPPAEVGRGAPTADAPNGGACGLAPETCDDGTNGTYATQGALRVTADDVRRALDAREQATGRSVVEAIGPDWLDNDAFLARLTDTLLQQALLAHDCEQLGVEPDIAAWTERRVAALTEDDVWDAWRRAHDRIRLTAVDVPNIFSRTEVDAFLAADDGAVARWYADHANHFLRPPDPADPAGRRVMRPLDDTLRREIAQRMLREAAVSESSAARAAEVRGVLERGDEAIGGSLGSGLRAVDTGPFPRAADGNVPTLGEAPELLDAVFAGDVAVGDVIGPIRTTSGLIVARVEARETPDRARFEAEREAFREAFLVQVRESAWQARVAEYARLHAREVDLEALRAALASDGSGASAQPRSTDTGRTQ